MSKITKFLTSRNLKQIKRILKYYTRVGDDRLDAISTFFINPIGPIVHKKFTREGGANPPGFNCVIIVSLLRRASPGIGWIILAPRTIDART